MQCEVNRMNYSTGGAEISGRSRLRILRLDLARQPAARGESAGDGGPDGAAGLHDITEDSIDGVFIEDAQVAVGVDIHLERFQLQTRLVGHVMDRHGAEIRQVRLWADGGIFGNLDGNLVTLILVREGLDIGQRRRDAALGMPFVVTQFRGFRL